MRHVRNIRRCGHLLKAGVEIVSIVKERAAGAFGQQCEWVVILFAIRSFKLVVKRLPFVL